MVVVGGSVGARIVVEVVMNDVWIVVIRGWPRPIGDRRRQCVSAVRSLRSLAG